MTRRGMLQLLAALNALLLAGCGPEGAAQAQSKPAPAKLTKSDGAGVGTITLTQEAESRLGLRVVAARVERIERARTRAGFVERAPDSDVVVRAPFAGVVRASAAGIPRAGTRVQPGRELLWLEPWISPSERAQFTKLHQELNLTRVQSRGALQRALAREAAAMIAVERAQSLLAQDAGSARARDDARGEHEVAVAELAAARALEETLSALSVGDVPARIPILASGDAQIVDVAVAADQSVEAGATLMTLARRDALWLRVPIYVGDLGELATDRDVSWSTGSARGEPRIARPIDAPPSADAAAATVDAWYAVEGVDDELRPGQRVDVTLRERGDEDVLAVPWSAVLYDSQGLTWVYVRVAELTFERRRVEIERRSGDLAVIVAGLAPGVEVVAEAAAELFGVEFGAGK